MAKRNRQGGWDLTFDLHQYFQKTMKEKVEPMCGYHVVSREPEERTYIQVDFFCTVDLNRPYTGPEQGIRPLADFCRYNVIEVEGYKRTLDESRFRYHLGRTLVMENPVGAPSRQGEIGLTILTVHKPVKLLALERYRFEAVTPWKYRTRFIEDIPVTIIVLRELQRIKGGEPAAWLQVLEPDPQRRPLIWARILEQDLTGRERLKSVMMKIDKEAFMTVAEEFRAEGRVVGFQEGLKLGEQKGLKLGEQRGLKLGEQKGLKLRAERDREIVRNLYHQGFETEMIVKVTGLSPEQLRSLMEGGD